jgi:aspartyl-tRNA(Asn)/glutamyl-tRNA(Gln) amidotransferase subunit A
MQKAPFKSATELLKLMHSKQISPVEVMKETINRIEKLNPVINAFTNLYPEQAMNQAKLVEKAISSGKKAGPLAGLPIGIKDLEDVEGMITSYGSVPYKNNIAKHDSNQASRLKAAGAIVVGKTNTPEFGFTGFTKNRLFGTTRNPWNKERTPGGSSGGSAAAVSSGMVLMATGSDGGGSIRIPSSYSGCFGLKTSAGRIPWGPTQMLYMDTISVMGPITRRVEDAALYLDCVCGYHPSDPRSLPMPQISYVQCLKNLPKKLKIAFSPTLGYARVQKDIMLRVEEAVKCFANMGHIVEMLDDGIEDPAEGWSLFMNLDVYGLVHEKLEANREHMSRAFVQSIEAVKSYTTADFIKATKIRTKLNNSLKDIFNKYDLLLTPTMPTEAFKAEGPPPSEIDGHPVGLLGALPFTYPFNLSGHPAASVPAGLSDNGLPVGLQIVGQRHRDDLVLQAAKAFEEAKSWNYNWPEIGD